MKTFYITAIIAAFLFIWSSAIKSQNIPNHVEFTKVQGTQKLDSIIYETWDTITSQWIFSKYEEYTHDYTWDSSGNTYLVNSYYGFGTFNDWIVRKKFESIYDANWNLTMRISYTWDFLTNQMVLYSKEEYSYDDNGNLVLEISYIYDSNKSQWNVSEKKEFSYDTNGNKTITQLINTSKNEATYDANGKLAYFGNYNWNSNTSQWIINTMYSLDTSRNTILFIDSDYSGQFKLEYTYDGNGNLTLFVPFQWDKNASKWIEHELKRFERSDIWKQVYTYDSNGNKTMEIIYNWDETANRFVNGTKTTWYYSPLNITFVPNTHLNKLTVYPNPAKDFIVFDLPNGSESVIVELYDIQGKKVVQQKLTETRLIAVVQLPKGLYLYRLADGETIYSGKLVVE